MRDVQKEGRRFGELIETGTKKWAIIIIINKITRTRARNSKKEAIVNKPKTLIEQESIGKNGKLSKNPIKRNRA